MQTLKWMKFQNEHELSCRFTSPQWELFCEQVGAGDEELNQLLYLHPLWKIFLIALWCQKQNVSTLQASAYVDIDTSLKMGDFFKKNEDMGKKPLLYNDRHS